MKIIGLSILSILIGFSSLSYAEDKTENPWLRNKPGILNYIGNTLIANKRTSFVSPAKQTIKSQVFRGSKNNRTSNIKVPSKY